MALRVNRPPWGEERRYVPKAFGNREDSDPCAVYIRQPTEAQRRAVTRTATAGAGFSIGSDGQPALDENGDIRISFGDDQIDWQREIVKRFVVRVENYTDSRGNAITNGEELAEHGDSAVVEEVANEIWEAVGLRPDAKKDSGASSDSTPATIAPSSGIAPSVGTKDLIESEAAA